jgi:hypothetical protein
LKLQQILGNALWEFYTYPFPNPLEMVRLGPVEAKPVTGPAGRVASHRRAQLAEPPNKMAQLSLPLTILAQTAGPC